MNIGHQLLAELVHEAQTTKKFLALVPSDKLDWAPHEKSMKLGPLAQHIAEIHGWAKEIIAADELDFATMEYKPEPIKDANDAVARMEKGLAVSKDLLSAASNEDMGKPWTMRQGEQIFFTLPKQVVYRTWVLNHIIHHRAQLGVYYRLLGIAVPGSYGPSADES